MVRMSRAQNNKDVTPFLTLWSYVFVVLSPRCAQIIFIRICGDTTHNAPKCWDKKVYKLCKRKTNTVCDCITGTKILLLPTHLWAHQYCPDKIVDTCKMFASTIMLFVSLPEIYCNTAVPVPFYFKDNFVQEQSVCMPKQGMNDLHITKPLMDNLATDCFN